MSSTTDILVVCAGIAGTSVAAELAAKWRVLLFEAESQPGYHSTGRSAAQLIQNYGPPDVRALTTARRAFYEARRKDSPSCRCFSSVACWYWRLPSRNMHSRWRWRPDVDSSV